MVADNDAMLFAVGLGQGASIAALKERLEGLAEVSGGRAIFAERTSKLSEAFAGVVESLTSQYTIGFEPARDGRQHRIEIVEQAFEFQQRRRQRVAFELDALTDPDGAEHGQRARRLERNLKERKCGRWNGHVRPRRLSARGQRCQR